MKQLKLSLNSWHQLLVMGTRVIFSSSDSLVAVSLSQTLKMLELMFYENSRDMEIAVDHEDMPIRNL